MKNGWKNWKTVLTTFESLCVGKIKAINIYIIETNDVNSLREIWIKFKEMINERDHIEKGQIYFWHHEVSEDCNIHPHPPWIIGEKEMSELLSFSMQGVFGEHHEDA